jgi:hypothetical protein
MHTKHTKETQSMTELSIGETVYILDGFGQPIHRATIERKTPAFYVVNDVKYSKETYRCSQNADRKYQGGKKPARITVATEALDETYARVQQARKVSRIERAEKSILSTYVDYMRSGNARNLSPEQIRRCNRALEDVLGSVADLGLRA